MTAPGGKRLTPGEVADRLGLHVRTVRRWVVQGLIPSIATPSDSKYGVRYRVREKDVRELERRLSTPVKHG